MTGPTTVAPAVLPAPLAIVPADQVEAAIAAAQHELQSLDAELARLLSEAAALEAASGDRTVDAASHEFVAVRFQRFLDGLRAEANAELDALMATADGRRTRGAVLSWDAFFAERTAARLTVPVAPVAPVAAAAPPVPAPPVTPTVPVVAAPPPVATPPVVAAAPAVSVMPVAPVAPVAPAVAVAPVVAAPAIVAAPTVPAATVGAPEVPTPEPAPAAPVMPVPMAVPRVPDAAPPGVEPLPVVDLAPPSGEQVLEAQFWSDEPSPGWQHARRTLRTVGWQAAAVLLLVAAVLVRVG